MNTRRPSWAYGEGGRIHGRKEFYDPDSLPGVYGAMTEYLGFDMLDGEYKVMGMAPYGRADACDLSRLVRRTRRGFRVNTRLVNTVGLRRFREDDGRGRYFGRGLVRWLGPPRRGDAADEPYVHYAAAMQELYERHCLALIDAWLADVLAETGHLVLAGGGALNVKLNQRILARPDVEALFVQPASGDSGTALGAATYVAAHNGDPPRPMRHVFLGPAFDTEACETAARARAGVAVRRLRDVVADTADLLAAGHPVAWFQGRMEFGPRALGARSILGCPSVPGIADRINAQIKYRERWRPFCPSILDRVAPEIIGTDHPAPFMTVTFDVGEAWRTRIPEVVHADGTARVQVVERRCSPALLRLDRGPRGTDGPRRRAQHVAQPPWRTDRVYAGRRAHDVPGVRPCVSW